MGPVSATERVASVPGELHYLAQGSFRIDIHGFEISGHRSAVSEFTDRAEVDAVYIPEVVEFVKERTGADEMVLRGAVLRRSAAPAASVWRVFSPPPQDWPLAVCDFRSRHDDEGLPNQLYFVDRLPDDPFAEVDESKIITSGSEFHYNPDHEWWYFPDMTRDEVLFFVFHDSDRSRPWRVLHSASRDPSVETAVPRHSIEVRMFAFFH
jgi:hypothetical protein